MMRKRLKKQKKGSVIDVIFFAVIMFAFAFSIIIGHKLFDTINDEIQANNDLSSSSKTISSDLQGKYTNLFDGIWATTFVLLGIVIVVGAYFIYLHPVFYVPSLFIMVFVIIIAAALSNVFSEATTDNELTESKDAFSLIPFVMNDYLTYIVMFGFAIIISSYAKYKGDQQQ